jgi:hypothetical protein
MFLGLVNSIDVCSSLLYYPRMFLGLVNSIDVCSSLLYNPRMFLGFVNSIHVCSSLLYNPRMFLGLVNSIYFCFSLLYTPYVSRISQFYCCLFFVVVYEEQTSIELTNPRNIRGLYNSEEQTSIELNYPRNTRVIQQRGTNINRIVCSSLLYSPYVPRISQFYLCLFFAVV